MEDLTKHQLVLVALLVSFVTSIATGIFTVALMEQAPQGVTQTVNHVIQETVEKVVPTSTIAAVSGANNSTSNSSNSGAVNTVSEDQLAVAAVAQNSKSLVRIQSSVDTGSIFLGMGAFLSKDGYVLANTSVITGGTDYVGVLANGSTTPLQLIAQNEESQLAYFKISGDATTTAEVAPFIVPMVLGNSDNVMTGQSVIAMGGQPQDVINRGTVDSLVSGINGLASIETDISFAQATNNYLSILFGLDGQVIGFGPRRDDGSDSASFLPIDLVKAQLTAIIAASSPTTSAATATTTATTTQKS